MPTSANGANARANSRGTWLGQSAANPTSTATADPASHCAGRLRRARNSAAGSIRPTSATASSTTACNNSRDSRPSPPDPAPTNSTAVEIRSCNSGCRVSTQRATAVKLIVRRNGRTHCRHATPTTTAKPLNESPNRNHRASSEKPASSAITTNTTPTAAATVNKPPLIHWCRRIRRITSRKRSIIGWGKVRIRSSLFMAGDSGTRRSPPHTRICPPLFPPAERPAKPLPQWRVDTPPRPSVKMPRPRSMEPGEIPGQLALLYPVTKPHIANLKRPSPSQDASPRGEGGAEV